MKIEKLFSIRIYDGKKFLLKALTKTLRELRNHTDWPTKILWDEKAILQKLTSGTLFMIMLEDEVCGFLDYHVQPLPYQNSSLPNLHDKQTIWISDFAIRPSYEHLGLARMLMNVAVNYSCYLDKRQIRIFKSSDEKLNGFMEHYGFKLQSAEPKNTAIYEIKLSRSPRLVKASKQAKVILKPNVAVLPNQ
ncbi:GNAT family N-acetyltransferase [Pedobacter paludis]|nr:GNAT family N-acetyltransferase [Pedobacter paludis]